MAPSRRTTALARRAASFLRTAPSFTHASAALEAEPHPERERRSASVRLRCRPGPLGGCGPPGFSARGLFRGDFFLPFSSKSGATTKQAGGTKGVQNGEPNASFSGLDAQGNMRIGERYSISVRGDKLVILQSHSGREVEVSEDTLAGLIEQEYFVDQK